MCIRWGGGERSKEGLLMTKANIVWAEPMDWFVTVDIIPVTLKNQRAQDSLPGVEDAKG